MHEPNTNLRKGYVQYALCWQVVNYDAGQVFLACEVPGGADPCIVQSDEFQSALLMVERRRSQPGAGAIAHRGDLL